MKKRSALRWVLPTIGSLLTLGAFAGTMGPLADKLFAGDGDVGRHIRLGSHILQTGHIPRSDLFSFTMSGQRFVPYEWLSEVVFAAAHALLGLGGVALVTALLFAATNTLVYWTTVRMGAGRPLAALVTTYGMILQSSHLLPRPHLFTTLLTAVTFALLLEFRRSRDHRWLWALPPLFAVWANLHGGFLIGFVLFAVFAGEAGWRFVSGAGDTKQAGRGLTRPLLGVGLLCLAATLLNPVGVEILPHTVGYLRESFLVDVTQEYTSPDFHGLAGRYFLGEVLVLVLVLLSGRARPSFLGGSLFLVWLTGAMFARRNIPIFAVLMAPFLGLWLTQAIRSLGDSSGLAGPARRYLAWSDRISRTDAGLTQPAGLLLAIGAAAVLFLSPALRSRYVWASDVFPVQAVQHVRAGPPGQRVFNQFTWGGYLLYAAPEIPVFIDGQTDFYGEQLTRDYLTILSAQPGWDSLLVAYDVDWTLIESAQPLNQVLELSPGWRRIYEDSTAVIFRRHP